MSAITWDREPVLSLPVRYARPRAASRPAAPVVTARPAPTRPTASDARADAAAGREHLRLTTRGRTVVWALAIAIAAAVGLSAQSAGADAPGAALPVETHVVASGETLWQIAGAVAAPGEDLRDVVAELVELNGLDDGGLQAGQEILVPAH